MTASQQGRSCLMPLLLIAALLGGTVGSVPSAAAAPVVYFVPQTGHTIELGFAQYVATHGGVEVTGYPLTEEIDEHGRVVQYFQHLRLEWHPEYPAAQQVYAGQLGLELHKAQPPVPPPPAGSADLYVPATGHRLAAGFLRYYESHDGSDLLGLPISEELAEGGAVVQYFTNAQLRWQPGSGVTVGDLGVQAVTQRGWTADKPPLARVDAPAGALPMATAAPPAAAPPSAPVQAAAPAAANAEAPLSATGSLVRAPGGRGRVAIPVLMYHHIGSWPSPYSVFAPSFAAQLAWLRANGYQAVTLRQVIAALYGPAALPAKPVAITIDDGYDDAATTARDLLLQAHMTATFFIPTWQTSLSAGTLRAMDGEGFDLEAHSRTHPDLTTLSDEAAWNEIKGSKDDLERILGHSVDVFAYPYGAVNGRVATLVTRAGYRAGILASDTSRVYSVDTPLAQPRILVDRGDDLGNFSAKVLGQRYRDTLGGGGTQPSLPATPRRTGDGELPVVPPPAAPSAPPPGVQAPSAPAASPDNTSPPPDNATAPSETPPVDDGGNTMTDGSPDSSNPGGHGEVYG